MGHEYVSTLHLMLASVADGRSRGARWLKCIRTSRERLRAAVESVMPPCVGRGGSRIPARVVAPAAARMLPMSPLARNVVDAIRQSPEPGDLALLSSVLAPSEGNVANVLEEIGLSLKTARTAVRKLAQV